MMITSVFLLTKPALAKCEGGEEIQGIVNNHTYCKSIADMKWWAALAWCEFQGRQLVTLDEACDGWSTANGDTMCPNLKIESKTGRIWTANTMGSSSSYYVDLSNGSVGYITLGSYMFTNYALCY